MVPSDIIIQGVYAGTGHRPNKLAAQDCYSQKVKTRLTDLALKALDTYKPKRVISGMALGWDIALAEASSKLAIPWTAAIPFNGQESKWPFESRRDYKRLLGLAESRVVVNTGGYAAWKMQTRNIWMVDRAEFILALWDGSAGGTGNCIEYADKTNKTIINLWQSWTTNSGVY